MTFHNYMIIEMIFVAFYWLWLISKMFGFVAPKPETQTQRLIITIGVVVWPLSLLVLAVYFASWAAIRLQRSLM